MLRVAISDLLKRELSSLLRNARTGKRKTQEEMAELLEMDTRSYQELERGRSLCGTVTLFLFMLEFSDIDVTYICELIKELKENCPEEIY